MTLAEWVSKTGIEPIDKGDWFIVKPVTVESHAWLFELTDMEPVAMTGTSVFLAKRVEVEVEVESKDS